MGPACQRRRRYRRAIGRTLEGNQRSPGLLQKKFIGFVAAMMVFAVCVYFPLLYAFRESMSLDIVLVVIFLWAIPSLLGIFCLWINRKLFITN